MGKPIRPNIILIMTDQQRYDTIAALGYPWMQTPNMDRLVEEGVAFTHCYTTAPSCVPSRASFFSACYPHVTGVYHNHCLWNRTWVSLLRDSGYHCVNIGKMHTMPFDAECGFDERFIVENKDRLMELDAPHGGFFDEWDKFLAHCGQPKPSRVSYRKNERGFRNALGAFEFPLEERYHPDVFVADTVRWYLGQRRARSPLFLQIGFPGPHPPYDPPRRFLDRYAGTVFPIREATQDELTGQPPPQAGFRRDMIEADHDSIEWQERPSPESLQRLRRHYAANISLIDEKVGEILLLLDELGYLESSVVVFMSDHGDHLGDHGHIQKFLMYEATVRIPMILWSPSLIPRGLKLEGLTQHIDIPPTLFDAIGLKLNGQVDGVSLWPGFEGGRERVFSEHSRCSMMRHADFMTMIRSRRHKLVHYLDCEYGELYDLSEDPGETRNLWSHPDLREVRTSLIEEILNWRVRDSMKNV